MHVNSKARMSTRERDFEITGTQIIFKILKKVMMKGRMPRSKPEFTSIYRHSWGSWINWEGLAVEEVGKPVECGVTEPKKRKFLKKGLALQESSGQRSDCWVWLVWGHQGPRTKRPHESDPSHLSLRWLPCPSLVPTSLSSHHTMFGTGQTMTIPYLHLWMPHLLYDKSGPKQPFLPCGLLSL